MRPTIHSFIHSFILSFFRFFLFFFCILSFLFCCSYHLTHFFPLLFTFFLSILFFLVWLGKAVQLLQLLSGSGQRYNTWLARNWNSSFINNFIARLQEFEALCGRAFSLHLLVLLSAYVGDRILIHPFKSARHCARRWKIARLRRICNFLDSESVLWNIQGWLYRTDYCVLFADC